MAGKPVSVEFIADVAQYLRETKKVAVSTEDIADALVNVSEDAADLERKLSRAMKDSARDVETLERAVKDIPKATDDMADQSARDFDRVGDEAKDAGREAGSEFKQNLGAGLAQGGSVGDMLTETVGALIGSLEGAAGGALALIGGVALVAFNGIKQSWEETQQAISESAESMWSTVMDNVKGKVGETVAAVSKSVQVAEELDRLWRNNADDMAELVRQAELLGINSNDVLLARAGDESAIKRVNDALAISEEKTDNYLGMTGDTITAHDDIAKAIGRGGAAHDINQAKLDAYNDSLPATAQLTSDIAANIDRWAPGVKKTEEQRALLQRALNENPLNLEVRLHADADQLRQLFPYGVSSGPGYVYDPARGPKEPVYKNKGGSSS